MWVKSGRAAAAAALFGITATAGAQDASELQAQIASLRAEVAQLRTAQGDAWLNERRAQEIKGLISEVLADADARPNLGGEGLLAGHDGKKFYLKSADDAFLMNLDGQIQLRYIFNYQDGRADELQNGFQMRRVKVAFAGHIGSPKIGYDLVLATERNSFIDDGLSGGDVFVEDVRVNYAFADAWDISAGRFKLPFARQELQSSKRQLAVDRSSVLEYFTLNRAEQVQLQYTGGMFKVAGAFSDGANTGFDDFNEGTAEYALTARADAILAGDWKQAADTVAWEDDLGAFVGGAFHWEQADEDATGSDADFWVATIDGLVKSGQLAGQAAFFYADGDEDAGPDDAWGVFLEGGYSLSKQWQPFARWEYLDVDDAGEEVQIATVGVNYYLKGHAAKFTMDLAWKYAGDNPPTLGRLNGGEFSDGLGFSGGVTDDEDQVALRTQFQLLF